LSKPLKFFVPEKTLRDLEQAAKINHLSLNYMLALIANEMKKGHLTVYNGEIATKKTLYETPKGIVIK